MKRIIALALLVVMAVSVFAGCSSSDNSSDVKLSKVLSQINEKYPDAVKNLKELKSKDEITSYYDVDEKDIADFAAERIKDSSQAALEIVIIKAKDKSAKTNIEQKLTVRYNGILGQYASYSAKQLKLAKAGGVKTSGDYVYLVVADNSDGIFRIIKDAVS